MEVIGQLHAPAFFTTSGENRYQLNRTLWRREKNFHLCQDTKPGQSVPQSCSYTDYDIPFLDSCEYGMNLRA